MAFVVFSTGVPAFAAYLGVDNPAALWKVHLAGAKCYWLLPSPLP